MNTKNKKGKPVNSFQKEDVSGKSIYKKKKKVEDVSEPHVDDKLIGDDLVMREAQSGVPDKIAGVKSIENNY